MSLRQWETLSRHVRLVATRKIDFAKCSQASASRPSILVASARADERGLVGRRAGRSPSTHPNAAQQRHRNRPSVLSPRRRAARDHPRRLLEVRVEGGLPSRRTDRRARDRCPMPTLLERLAAPGCPKVGSQWDRCGVHYVEPIGRCWDMYCPLSGKPDIKPTSPNDRVCPQPDMGLISKRREGCKIVSIPPD